MSSSAWPDRLRRNALRAIAGISIPLMTVATAALAQTKESANACGSLRASEGPYDYRTHSPRIAFIESNHFQPQVEALISGVSGPIGAELDFLLSHVPNHHKALLLLITYGERLKWTPAPGMRYGYECWYERAVRWQPQDSVVRMIYAMYLNKRSRTKEALAQLATATELAADNGFTHYNVGLIYLEMKQYDLALAQAHRAIELEFPRTQLRERLESAGKWKEPSPAARDDAAAVSTKPAASAAKP